LSLTYAQFLADPSRRNTYLVSIDALDTTDESAVTVRLANRKFDTGASDTPANTRYWPRLVGIPYSYSTDRIPIGTLGVAGQRRGGEIRIGQVMGDLDLGTASMATALGISSFRDLTTGGRTATILHGGSSKGQELLFSSYATVYSGLCGEAEVGRDEIRIPLPDPESRLAYPLQSRVYTGATYALYFDGAGDDVNCTNNATYNYTSGTQSWEFWVNVPSLAAEMFVVSRGSYEVDGYTIAIETDGSVHFTTNQAAAHQANSSSTGAVVVDTWTHVAVVYNGSTTSRIYINGELDSTETGHTAPLTSTRTLYFGRGDGGGNLLTGYLYDIRVWNDQRTADEVAEYYQRFLTASDYSTDLDGNWQCQDGSGSTLADSTSTQNGTITGAVFYPALQGTSDLEGTVLPDVFGRVECFEPVLVDEARRIYQVHSGKVNAISACYEGGSALTLGTGYTATATFFAASTTAAKYDTLNVNGGCWIRLGSNPTKPITVDVQGDKYGGTYRSTAGTIVRLLATTRGKQPLTDPDEIDTTAFSDLDTANSSVLGYATREQVQVLDVCNFLLRSIGAEGWFARSDGKLTVARFEGSAAAGTPTYTITEKDVAEGSLEALTCDPPTESVEIKYRRNYRKHSVSDLVSGVTTTSRGRWLQRDWDRKAALRYGVGRVYKDAQKIRIDTGFTTAANARTEAKRLATIFDGKSKAFRMRLRDRFGALDVFDPVYFHYQGRDKTGDKQALFGTSASSKWIVLGVEEMPDSNEIQVVIWQEG